MSGWLPRWSKDRELSTSLFSQYYVICYDNSQTFNFQRLHTFHKTIKIYGFKNKSTFHKQNLKFIDIQDIADYNKYSSFYS